MITFHIITIFPKAFDSYLKEGIILRAVKKKLIEIKFYNPRDFTCDKYRQVDDRPYGGGPGMVMKAEPIIKAVGQAVGRKKDVKIIILSPRGRQFTNAAAAGWIKKYRHIVLIAGRYEGIDARVKKILRAEEVSIGSYTLMGGELPALVLLDCLSRQISGVLGKPESLEEKRVASGEIYTRPEILLYQGKEYRAPKTLLSGDHKKIDTWRARHNQFQE